MEAGPKADDFLVLSLAMPKIGLGGRMRQSEAVRFRLRYVDIFWPEIAAE